MKKEFIKEHGKMIEKLVIDHEAKWIYIHFTKGHFEKSSYFLKNEPTATIQLVQKFFEEYHVSDELREEVIKHLTNEKSTAESHFQEFLNFLITTLSMHLMVGVALGISIYGGYKLGYKLDEISEFAPAFTVIGVMFGFAVGTLTAYVMIRNYFGKEMLAGFIPTKESVKKLKRGENQEWPVINPRLTEIQEAIRLFAKELPTGMNRTILIMEDFRIDFEQLAPYLGGVPSKPYYMSKETFEIFEEQEKALPAVVDKVQKAVHLYYKVNNRYPIRPYDSLKRVNYHQLIQGHYLDEKPDVDLYFTDYDSLITHIKPNKKQLGG
jgi:F0F1-type ATP synthase assembly protein I